MPKLNAYTMELPYFYSVVEFDLALSGTQKHMVNQNAIDPSPVCHPNRVLIEGPDFTLICDNRRITVEFRAINKKFALLACFILNFWLDVLYTTRGYSD